MLISLFFSFLFVLQALWVLASVAFVSPEYRDLVLDHGGLSALLLQLNKHTTVSMLRVATWTLSTFCNGRPQPTLDQVAMYLWDDFNLLLPSRPK